MRLLLVVLLALLAINVYVVKATSVESTTESSTSTDLDAELEGDDSSLVESESSLDAAPKQAAQPKGDISRGLAAWFRFSGDSKDSTSHHYFAAPRSASTASGGGKKGDASQGGPQLTTDRFGIKDQAYSFRRANGEYFEINSKDLKITSEGLSVSVWARLESLSASGSNGHYSILSRNFPNFYYMVQSHFHQQRVGHERAVPRKADTCAALHKRAVEFTAKDKSINLLKDAKDAEKSTLSLSRVPSDKWVHLAFTHDGCTQKFYVNGKLSDVSLTAFDFPTEKSGKGVWNIGSMGCGAKCETWNGDLDDVRIYTRAITGHEINAIQETCDVCENGGQCKQKNDNGKFSFTCTCPKGTSGARCEKLAASAKAAKAAVAAAKKPVITTAKKAALKKPAKKPTPAVDPKKAKEEAARLAREKAAKEKAAKEKESKIAQARKKWQALKAEREKKEKERKENEKKRQAALKAQAKARAEEAKRKALKKAAAEKAAAEKKKKAEAKLAAQAAARKAAADRKKKLENEEKAKKRAEREKKEKAELEKKCKELAAKKAEAKKKREAEAKKKREALLKAIAAKKKAQAEAKKKAQAKKKAEAEAAAKKKAEAEAKAKGAKKKEDAKKAKLAKLTKKKMSKMNAAQKAQAKAALEASKKVAEATEKLQKQTEEQTKKLMNTIASSGQSVPKNLNLDITKTKALLAEREEINMDKSLLEQMMTTDNELQSKPMDISSIEKLGRNKEQLLQSSAAIAQLEHELNMVSQSHASVSKLHTQMRNVHNNLKELMKQQQALLDSQAHLEKVEKSLLQIHSTAQHAQKVDNILKKQEEIHQLLDSTHHSQAALEENQLPNNAAFMPIDDPSFLESTSMSAADAAMAQLFLSVQPSHFHSSLDYLQAVGERPLFDPSVMMLTEHRSSGMTEQQGHAAYAMLEQQSAQAPIHQSSFNEDEALARILAADPVQSESTQTALLQKEMFAQVPNVAKAAQEQLQAANEEERISHLMEETQRKVQALKQQLQQHQRQMVADE